MPELTRLSQASRVFVAGHRGLVGSAIVRCLEARGFRNVLVRSHADLDLCDQASVSKFFVEYRPEFVFLAAARVGGILANSTHPAEFLYDNLAIQTNVIHSAWMNGAKKLLFFGSSCIYPRLAPQPIKEEYLLTGSLEPTNEAYAVAKIAGLKLAAAYHAQYGFAAISLMPTNLYGPGDNFDRESSHVLPAMIHQFHEAKIAAAPEVTLWGTGTPRREFLHVDDLANAACFLMENYDAPDLLNVGVGKDLTIAELAALVARVIGYKGPVVFDRSHPDGTPRKLLDISRIHALGWHAQISLERGIESTYQWYLRHITEGVLAEESVRYGQTVKQTRD
jgi:GDP-L-fucose synthase